MVLAVAMVRNREPCTKCTTALQATRNGTEAKPVRNYKAGEPNCRTCCRLSMAVCRPPSHQVLEALPDAPQYSSLRFITFHYVSLLRPNVSLRFITFHYSQKPAQNLSLRFITFHYSQKPAQMFHYVSLRFITPNIFHYVSLRFITFHYRSSFFFFINVSGAARSLLTNTFGTLSFSMFPIISADDRRRSMINMCTTFCPTTYVKNTGGMPTAALCSQS
jgi:hypothetical protein